jgi:hypothetical protein
MISLRTDPDVTRVIARHGLMRIKTAFATITRTGHPDKAETVTVMVIVVAGIRGVRARE